MSRLNDECATLLGMNQFGEWRADSAQCESAKRYVLCITSASTTQLDPSNPTTTTTTGPCVDNDVLGDCAQRMSEGKCTDPFWIGPGDYMCTYCKKTCNLCGATGRKIDFNEVILLYRFSYGLFGWL